MEDFEAAVWVAVKGSKGQQRMVGFHNNDYISLEILPKVKIFGFAFHFTQAVFRKIKEHCLVPSHMNAKNCNEACKQLLALHLNPTKNNYKNV